MYINEYFVIICFRVSFVSTFIALKVDAHDKYNFLWWVGVKGGYR